MRRRVITAHICPDVNRHFVGPDFSSSSSTHTVRPRGMWKAIRKSADTTDASRSATSVKVAATATKINIGARPKPKSKVQSTRQTSQRLLSEVFLRRPPLKRGGRRQNCSFSRAHSGIRIVSCSKFDFFVTRFGTFLCDIFPSSFIFVCIYGVARLGLRVKVSW